MTSQTAEQMIKAHDRSIAEIWALFKANDERTNAKIAKVSEDIDKLSKATDEKLVKVSNDIDKLSQEVAKVSKDVATFNNTVGNLTDRWGKFIENFVLPGIPKAFTERGIKITRVIQRLKASEKGRTVMEIDHLAINTDCAILIEAKSILKVSDVKVHLEKIKKFRQVFTEYQAKKLYGAVAAVEIASSADQFAIGKGLFVLNIGDDSVAIANKPDFKPSVW